MSFESVAIDHSYEAIEVLVEVGLEMFPLTVLALVSQRWHSVRSARQSLWAALLLQGVASLAIVLFIWMFGRQFIDWISTPQGIQDDALQFFRMQSLTIPFQCMYLILLMGLKSIRKGRLVLAIVLVGVLINISLDLLLISNYSFSWKLGLIGSAWSRLLTLIFQFVVTGILAYRIFNTNEVPADSPSNSYKQVMKVGVWFGLESLIRNLGYIIGVLALINLISRSEPNAIAAYNTTMWILWGIIFIPVLAWTEATQIVMGNLFGDKNLRAMKETQWQSGLIAVVYILVWFLASWNIIGRIAGWLNPVLSEDIITLTVRSFRWFMIPYLLFVIGSFVKTVFVSTGRSFILFSISAIVNVAIVIPVGLLVKAGLLTVSYQQFLLIMIVVFSCDFILTVYVFYYRAYKPEWLSSN